MNVLLSFIVSDETASWASWYLEVMIKSLSKKIITIDQEGSQLASRPMIRGEVRLQTFYKDTQEQ